MYTEAMSKAFHSLNHHAPNGFKVKIMDHDHFLSVRASEAMFMKLTEEDKRRAIEYMVRVKKALEDNGAIVLLVREGGKE